MKTARRAIAVLGILALVLAAMAGAAKVKNGGFEEGSEGWNVSERGGGTWFFVCSFPRGAPISGSCSASSSAPDPASLILYQDVRLRRGHRHRLSFSAGYVNEPGEFFARHSLSHTKVPNQQFRVDVVDPDAPLRSVDRKDVLVNVFKTESGAGAGSLVSKYRASLSKFAGRKVRLRFAVVATEGDLNVTLDDVKIRSRKRG